MANLRLVLEVEVQAGNQNASSSSAPGFWALLERIPKENWPALIRGDCDGGTDAVMTEAEQRGVHYLFKRRPSPNVKKLIIQQQLVPYFE